MSDYSDTPSLIDSIHNILDTNGYYKDKLTIDMGVLHTIQPVNVFEGNITEVTNGIITDMIFDAYIYDNILNISTSEILLDNIISKVMDTNNTKVDIALDKFRRYLVEFKNIVDRVLSNYMKNFKHIKHSNIQDINVYNDIYIIDNYTTVCEYHKYTIFVTLLILRKK